MKPVKYYATSHAKDQAAERFGWTRGKAEARMQELLQTSVYRGMDGNARYFDHERSGIRMVLAKDKNVVITLYAIEAAVDDFVPFKADTPTLSNAIATTVKRELTKAAREFKRSQRTIIEEIAFAQIEVAEAMLRKVRVHNPETQAIIQRKIDDLNAKIYRKQAEIAEAEAEFAKLQTDAQRFVATE